MTTAIVGCSKTKIDTDEPVPAIDLYDSTYFDKRFRVASQYDDVRILSAKHGVIDTDEEIGLYDVSMYDLTASERRAIADNIDTSSFDDHVVVLAGQMYVEVIERACDDHDVESPLDGGIGEQLSQLNDMIEAMNDGE